MTLLRAVVTTAFVAGCGGSSSGPRIEPRDGVTIVYEGPSVSNPDCEFRQTFPAHCPSWTDLVIQDAAREGDRVGLLFYTSQPGGSFGVVLAESDDLGRTWRTRFFGSPPTSGGSPSLQLAGGKTYIHWVVSIEAPLGNRPVGQRWELEPTGIERTELYDTGMLAQVLSTENGRARTFIGPTDLNDPRSGFLDISWAADEPMARFSVRCQGVLGCNPHLITADGLTFVSHFDRYESVGGAVQPTAACFFSTSAQDVPCAPWSSWPAPTAELSNEAAAVIHETNGDFVAARLYAQGGRTYAERLLPGSSTLGPRIDFDEGRPPRFGEPAAFVGYRPRFRGLTGVVRPSGYMELYRLRGLGGVDRVDFPDSPCATLERCAEAPFFGYGQAQWLLPLGGDDALVFYVVDSYLGDVSNHQWIYASRETVTYEELAAPQEDPDLLYPGWRPASPLEAMCVRAASCYPDAGVIPSQCAGFWSWRSSANPGQEAALARFLATPPGCAGFATSWPELTVADHDCSVSTCPGGCDTAAGVPVCLATAPCGVACTMRGGTCLGNGTCSLTATTAECDSCTADGRAVTCGTVDGVLTVGGVYACPAGGFTCELGPRCVDRTTCAIDGDRCESGTSVQCNSGVVSRTDCAATGWACAANGQCAPDPAAQTCTAVGAECRGTTLYTCPGNGSAWMRVDCAALGFARCVEDVQTGFGRCE